MKKFENIILASDIDGTFVWHYNEVSPKNIEKVKYFVENGGHFLFSSGRNSKDITVVAASVIDLVNTPCVLTNGGMLFDVKNDVIENPVYVDTDELMTLLEDVDSRFPDVGFRASYSGGFVARANDEFIQKEMNNYDVMKFATLRPLPEFRNYKFFKAIFRQSKERIAEISEYIIPKYSDRLSFTRSSENILEVQPLGISKAYQLKYLKEKFMKTNPDTELWCVGDFDNDIDMLRFADIAACPENASDAIKSIASVHLCHCKDGAVGQLIDIIEERISSKK